MSIYRLIVVNTEDHRHCTDYEFKCGCDCSVDISDGYVIPGIPCREHSTVVRAGRISMYRRAIVNYRSGLNSRYSYPYCTECGIRHAANDEHCTDEDDREIEE